MIFDQIPSSKCAARLVVAAGADNDDEDELDDEDDDDSCFRRACRLSSAARAPAASHACSSRWTSLSSLAIPVAVPDCDPTF